MGGKIGLNIEASKTGLEIELYKVGIRGIPKESDRRAFKEAIAHLKGLPQDPSLIRESAPHIVDGQIVGFFIMTRPAGQFVASARKVEKKGDILFWETWYPQGVVIKYPCGTRRFINEVDLNEAIKMCGL